MTISIGHADPAWVQPLVNFLALLFGAALTWATTNHFEKRRLEDSRLGIAYGLIFKIQSLSDEIWKIQHHTKEHIAEAKKEGLSGSLWTMLPDILGFDTSPEKISSSELALVASTKNSSILMKILELESGHHILIQSLTTISQLKAQLANAGLGSSVDGRVVSFAANSAEYAKNAHIFISLEDLSKNMETQIDRIAENARTVSEEIGPLLKSHYHFRHFVTLAMSTKYDVAEDSNETAQTEVA